MVEMLGWHGVVVAAAGRSVWPGVSSGRLPDPPSLHLSDGRGAVLRPASFADNMWKGVGVLGKQLLGFCPVFCLLWRMFPADVFSETFVISDESCDSGLFSALCVFCLLPSIRSPNTWERETNLERSAVLSHLWSALMWCLVEQPS